MTPQQRYVAAAHAMQSGVKADMETDAHSQGATRPKDLRVGVNSALAATAALTKLLVDKGIITDDEYLEAVATAMEDEHARYEQILTERFGSPVTLA